MSQLQLQTGFFTPISRKQTSYCPTVSRKSPLQTADVFLTFGHSVTIAPGQVVRVDKVRPIYVPGGEGMERVVNLYSAIIPAAGSMFSKTRLATPNQDYSDVSFNRRQRIAVFYLLSAIAELNSPESNPDIQLERMRQILISIENIATEKIEADETSTEIFTEDPRFMKAQVGDRQAFRLQGQNVVKADYKISSGPTFPEPESILVIPSTWEYTFIDQAGRVMVVRVDPSCGRNFPYKHLKVDDINTILKTGKIILNMPKMGKDFLGRDLAGIYIDRDWLPSTEVLNELPEKQRAQVDAVLKQIPKQPFVF